MLRKLAERQRQLRSKQKSWFSFVDVGVPNIHTKGVSAMKIVHNEGFNEMRSRERRALNRASDWCLKAKRLCQANQACKAMARGVALEEQARELWEIK